MASALGDLVVALRSIARRPLVAGTIVLSLGAAIGVNATVFSWIQTVVFNPLPGVVGSGSLHFIEAVTDTGGYPSSSWREFLDLRARVTALRDLTAFRMVALYVGEPGRTERAYGELVAGNFFPMLGLTPAAGRLLAPADAAAAGGERVAVISYDYWQTRYAGDASAIGATIRVNDAVLTIVGVAPRDFQGSVLGLSFDAWLPATLAPVLVPGSTELDDRTTRGYSVMGRLAPGATLAGAHDDVSRVMRELAAAYPRSNGNVKAEVLRFFDAPRGPQRFFASALWFLQIVMLLLLLTVCGNTANLVLARAMSRQREAGVRLALGAGPWRIARLIVIENLVLGLAGAGLGALTAVWGTEALRAVPMTGAFPVKFQTHVDGVTLLFAVVLGVLCGALFGTPPAAHLSTLEPRHAMNPGAAGSARSPLRSLLMAAQMAMAVIVLAVAALFVRSFSETRTIDPGFKTEGVLIGAYDLSGRLEAVGETEAARDDAARLFAMRLLARLSEHPAVAAAAVSTSVPLDIHGLPERSFQIATHQRADGKPDSALANTVTPRYFATLGIPFVAGADFAALDDRTAAPQAIVNDAFVKAYLGGAPALGQTLVSRGRSYTIVGVVATTTYDAFGEPPTPIVYYSYRDRPSWAGEVHLRSRPGLEDATASALRDAVRALDAELPVYNVRTMTEHIDRNLVLRKIPARMFVVLGPLLLVLAAIGVYAVVAFVVSQRTVEIGVRLALGASPSRVAAETALDSFKVAVNGIVFGALIVAVVDLHLVRGGSRDLPAVVGVPLLLAAVAGLACWWPARRAAGLNPMTALRRD